jgi:hypothetical protein
VAWSCSDGIKNGAETDIDCGGGACATCTNGKTCSANTDCASAYCSAGACQDSSCAGIPNVTNGTVTINSGASAQTWLGNWCVGSGAGVTVNGNLTVQ